MKISAEFIGGNANTTYNCISWSPNSDFYAFGCSNNIHIFDCKSNRVTLSLRGHEKRVNTTRFVSTAKHKAILLSAGADGLLIIWKCDTDPSDYEAWRIGNRIKIGENTSTITIKENSPDDFYLGTHDTNGEVKIYHYLSGELKELTTLHFGNNVQSAGALTSIDDVLLIFVAGLDFKIHLYLLYPGANEAIFTLSLKGHENAITNLEITLPIKGDHGTHQLLASSSKDGYIRLWKLAPVTAAQQARKKESSFQHKNCQEFAIGKQSYELALESILFWHTEAVSSLQWGLLNKSAPYTEENLSLLSASFDFSILIWCKEEAKEGIWYNKTRLGQMHGNKNAFFGARFNKECSRVLGYTFTGAIYLWEERGKDCWLPLFTPSGHSGNVTDLDWSSEGDYLTSCSQDQTTRVFAPWSAGKSWHEISRAQVHGYDINSIKNLRVLGPGDQRLIDILLCGADEKIIRLFEPAAFFANTLNFISEKELHLYFPDREEEKKYLQKNAQNKLQYFSYLEGGQQVLGLMTKAVKVEREKFTTYFEGGEEEEEVDELEDALGKEEGQQIALGENSYEQPPNEDLLMKHTLWPELNKLYGHGFEIKTVTSSHKGDIIASSCKSQVYDHSAIFLWDPASYAIVDRLFAHSFTPMQIEFSKNDVFIGSVSRDRQFCLFKRDAKTGKFSLFFTNKSHARVIWGLSFSHDSKFVVTGSRDKKIKFWKIPSDAEVSEINIEKTCECVSERLFKEGVTAVAFADRGVPAGYLLVCGFESGELEIFTFDGAKDIKSLGRVPQFLGHSASINRVKFQPAIKPEKERFTFASCSEDHSTRIFNVVL